MTFTRSLYLCVVMKCLRRSGTDQSQNGHGCDSVCGDSGIMVNGKCMETSGCASFKPSFRFSSMLHMSFIANSTSRMFSIQNNSCDELTRTACFNSSHCPVCLHHRLSLLIRLPCCKYVSSDYLYHDFIGSDGNVCTVFFHPLENTSPFFVGLCGRHLT